MEEKKKIRNSLVLSVILIIICIPAFMLNRENLYDIWYYSDIKKVLIGAWYNLIVYLPSLFAAVIFIVSIVKKKRSGKKILLTGVAYVFLLLLIIILCTSFGLFAYITVHLNSGWWFLWVKKEKKSWWKRLQSIL